LDGVRWQAEAEDAPIEDGASVVVTNVQGLKLTVRRGDADEQDNEGA
jgi:membrane-bound ClpP family serine protease